jgi:hypothetical protein
VRPKKQRLRKMSDEKIEAAKAEVHRLLEANFIELVAYPTWLANIVMVQKKSGKWRMCIDFTSLNKACPKDNFPLPRIDKIVDSAAECEVMSLLDCFSGYHQIYMNEEDKASTSFITPFGMYCFIRMPEGLKNSMSTFSHLTKTVLESQVGRNIFTYVDDIVVTNKSKEDHLADLVETFANMRDARLRLDSEKCVFGVHQGKILGYLVSHRGIEANPTKIQAIINMAPPQSARDVQRLTGRLAALNRFISKSAERSLPFLKTLRGTKDFAWGLEQATAFASLKQHLSELAILTSPNPSLPLLLYVAASPYAVSATLVQEQDREGRTRQCPVYYISEVLTTFECNMTELEKIAYAVVMASRKLRHYFEAFKVRVTSDRGLDELFRNPEASVRIAKWATELSGYHQVTSPSRLHRRLDRANNAAGHACREGMDHPLRRLMVPCGGRRSCSHYFTHRGQAPICNMTQLCFGVRQMHQQCSRVRSCHPRPSQVKGTWCHHLHNQNRLQSGCQPSQERLHSKGPRTYAVSRGCPQSRETIQGLYLAAHGPSQE